jgi:carbonic anhydrase
MLRNIRSHVPRLQPTLRSFGSGKIHTHRPKLPRQQASCRVTVRHCSSTAKDDNDMPSKHLETSHQRIFDNNRKWVETMKAEDPDFFVKLGLGQNPEYLFVFPKSQLKSHRNLTVSRYIGCSDSRVPANQIMGLVPGEVFTTRNIANLVPNTDLSIMSVINYAVRHLEVKHIVVCGHYGCGGVKAAMTPADLGILNPWLRNIRDVYRLHEAELDALPEDKRYDRLVELNVVEQCRNVIKTAAVQQSYDKDRFPIVHGWVFDIQTGLLRDLKVDFEMMLKGIKKLYNLSAVEEQKREAS